MNIQIYMKDDIYSKKLFDSLSKNFEDIDLKIIFEKDDIDNRYFLLTDFEDIDFLNKLIFSDEKGKNLFKYQSINFIFESIIKSYSNFKEDGKIVKIISVVSLDTIFTENKMARIIAKKFNTKGKTLLVNMNNFHKYGYIDGIEKGVEDTFFLDDYSGYEGNNYLEFDYLNSCYFPIDIKENSFEIYEKIINTLKKSVYKFVILDLNMSFNLNILNIFKNSSKIVLHYSKENEEKIYEYLNYLSNNKNFKGNFIKICKNSKEFKKISSNTYQINEDEEIFIMDSI